MKHIISTARDYLKVTKDDTLRHIFENTRFVEAIKQPKSIIRIVTNTAFRTIEPVISIPDQQPGLYAECRDKRCNLCHGGYIQQCTSFLTSNNTRWHIKSHINCNSKNVLYYLVCNMCQTNEPISKTGKTLTQFWIRLNNHISDCNTGRTSDIFDLHVHNCGIRNHCLKPPFFKVFAYMKLSSPDKLLSYEKYLHNKNFATIKSWHYMHTNCFNFDKIHVQFTSSIQLCTYFTYFYNMFLATINNYITTIV